MCVQSELIGPHLSWSTAGPYGVSALCPLSRGSNLLCQNQVNVLNWPGRVEDDVHENLWVYDYQELLWHRQGERGTAWCLRTETVAPRRGIMPLCDTGLKTKSLQKFQELPRMPDNYQIFIFSHVPRPFIGKQPAHSISERSPGERD